jgi:hypothetical protein
MNTNKEIFEKLNAISDKEWREIVDKLTIYVYFKLKGRTLFGAHSERNLGVNPVDYYVIEAIGKLYSFEWKWQFEKYSILEQLERIIGSLISKTVEKYKSREDIEINKNIENITDIAECESVDILNERYLIFREALEKCSIDDEELQLYIMAFDECNTFNEMQVTLGFEKKKLYALQKKLTRRLTIYLKTKKVLVL